MLTMRKTMDGIKCPILCLGFSEKILAVASSAKFKAISANDIKITVINEDEYRGVKRLLAEQSSTEGDFSGIVYHTYQLKNEKSFRAVIRCLPPTYNIEEITDWATNQLK